MIWRSIARLRRASGASEYRCALSNPPSLGWPEPVRREPTAPTSLGTACRCQSGRHRAGYCRSAPEHDRCPYPPPWTMMIPPLQARYRENQQPFVTLECADDSNAPCPLCSPEIPHGLADHRRKSHFCERSRSIKSMRCLALPQVQRSVIHEPFPALLSSQQEALLLSDGP
jgi:hypothetical protein